MGKWRANAISESDCNTKSQNLQEKVVKSLKKSVKKLIKTSDLKGVNFVQKNILRARELVVFAVNKYERETGKKVHGGAIEIIDNFAFDFVSAKDEKHDPYFLTCLICHAYVESLVFLEDFPAVGVEVGGGNFAVSVVTCVSHVWGKYVRDELRNKKNRPDRRDKNNFV